MDVVFIRVGERRYAVETQSADAPVLEMNPAPGYDPQLPHDLVHFIVENELGLERAVFGQLAAGGDASTFYLKQPARASRDWSRTQRQIKRRGAKLAKLGRDQAEFSERAALICHQRWLSESSRSTHRQEAAKLASNAAHARQLCTDPERELLSDAAVKRICQRLSRVAQRWQVLNVGESLRLAWSH